VEYRFTEGKDADIDTQNESRYDVLLPQKQKYLPNCTSLGSKEEMQELSKFVDNFHFILGGLDCKHFPQAELKEKVAKELGKVGRVEDMRFIDSKSLYSKVSNNKPLDFVLADISSWTESE